MERGGNPYKTLIQDILNDRVEFIRQQLGVKDPLEEERKQFGDSVVQFLRNGEKDDILSALLKKKLTLKAPQKENVAQKTTTVKKKGRPKNSILTDITPSALHVKVERVSDISEAESGISQVSVTSDVLSLPSAPESNINTETVHVKTEKVSISAPEAVTIKNETESTKTQTERQEMPAPTQLPPRKKKVKSEKPESRPVRNTRSKVRKAKGHDESIIEIETAVPTIELDVDDNVETVQKESCGSDTDSEAPRSTRTKTIKKKTKTNNQDETDGSDMETSVRSTRTRTVKKTIQEKPQNENGSTQNVPEMETNSRSTRTKTRKTAQVNAEEKVSETKEEEVPVRTTRTKTIRKAKKIEEEKEEVEFKIRKAPQETTEEGRKKSTSNKEKISEGKKRSWSTVTAQETEVNETNHSNYEDAQSIIDPVATNVNNATFVSSNGQESVKQASTLRSQAPLNSTMTLEKQKEEMNHTVVVENPKYVSSATEKQAIDNNLMTDDEDDVRTPPRKISKLKKAGGKEVFSPYEKTTLKKKVEAFEKLTQMHSEASNHATKAKMFTPILHKVLPSSSCSTSNINRIIPRVNNESTSAKAPGSALKASQMEYREMEKRRQEKEKEALKKKEALLQSLTEERKRKREEKQLKAQQHREALEKEKLKQLEIQKLKDERARQLKVERLQYQQKQKEEAEQKRILAKKRAELLAQQKQQQEGQPKVPIYMVTKPPLLPTYDCYDSDDERSANRHALRPSWARDENLKTMLLTMMSAGERLKNTFFSRSAESPDLEEILEVVDKSNLKRTSSVLWKKPPRYTLMPNLEETRFSEDEDGE